MKRKILAILLALSIIVGAVFPAIASDITNALYYGKIRATNSGTAAQNVAAVFSVNTSAWINAGILNSTASNVAIRNNTGVDTAFMPVYGSGNWSMWLDSVPATGSIDSTLYTNVTGGKIRYFPGPTGMTVPDDATLELSYNFSTPISGYFDATQAGKLFYKSGAYRLTGDGAGNVTAGINGKVEASYTTGNDTAQDIYGANWRAQSFLTTSAYTVTGVKVQLQRTGSPGTLTASIRATTAGNVSGADLTSGSINANSVSTGAGGEWVIVGVEPYALTDATTYAIVLRATAGDASNKLGWQVDGSAPAYTDGSYITSGDSGVSWAINTAQDTMFEVNSSYETTATGVTSGEKTFTVRTDHSKLYIDIDGVNAAWEWLP